MAGFELSRRANSAATGTLRGYLLPANSAEGASEGGQLSLEASVGARLQLASSRSSLQRRLCVCVCVCSCVRVFQGRLAACTF